MAVPASARLCTASHITEHSLAARASRSRHAIIKRLHQHARLLNRDPASQNISDQVDEVALYKAFVAYGEILQCFIDWDHYDQPFGHVQYIEESACIRAVERANGTGALGHNTIIQVQRHSRGLQQQPKQEE